MEKVRRFFSPKKSSKEPMERTLAEAVIYDPSTQSSSLYASSPSEEAAGEPMLPQNTSETDKSQGEETRGQPEGEEQSTLLRHSSYSMALALQPVDLSESEAEEREGNAQEQPEAKATTGIEGEDEQSCSPRRLTNTLSRTFGRMSVAGTAAIERLNDAAESFWTSIEDCVCGDPSSPPENRYNVEAEEQIHRSQELAGPNEGIPLCDLRKQKNDAGNGEPGPSGVRNGSSPRNGPQSDDKDQTSVPVTSRSFVQSVLFSNVKSSLLPKHRHIRSILAICKTLMKLFGDVYETASRVETIYHYSVVYYPEIADDSTMETYYFFEILTRSENLKSVLLLMRGAIKRNIFDNIDAYMRDVSTDLEHFYPSLQTAIQDTAEIGERLADEAERNADIAADVRRLRECGQKLRKHKEEFILKIRVYAEAVYKYLIRERGRLEADKEGSPTNITIRMLKESVQGINPTVLV